VPSPHSSEAERDRRLVEACNRGDERAFEQLYGCYRDWVFRLARRPGGSHEEALDVLQEGPGTPELEVRLAVAADAEGRLIEARVELR